MEQQATGPPSPLDPSPGLARTIRSQVSDPGSRAVASPLKVCVVPSRPPGCPEVVRGWYLSEAESFCEGQGWLESQENCWDAPRWSLVKERKKHNRAENLLGQKLRVSQSRTGPPPSLNPGSRGPPSAPISISSPAFPWQQSFSLLGTLLHAAGTKRRWPSGWDPVKQPPLPLSSCEAANSCISTSVPHPGTLAVNRASLPKRPLSSETPKPRGRSPGRGSVQRPGWLGVTSFLVLQLHVSCELQLRCLTEHFSLFQYPARNNAKIAAIWSSPKRYSTHLTAVSRDFS